MTLVSTIPARALTLICALFISGSLLAQQPFVDLRDFRDVEVKGAGFVLPSETTLRVKATGGGDKNFWEEVIGHDRPKLFAYGWIIDASTRERVWEMSFRNTGGGVDRRKFDDEVRLGAGSYEVYFAAYAYAHKGWFSEYSMNIDRPKGLHGRHDDDGDGFWSHFRDDEDTYEDFMEFAESYGISISAGENAANIELFEAPRLPAREVFAARNVGDRAAVRKQLTVTNDSRVKIYALGEGVRDDGMYDYAWIVDASTRKRVWEMTARNSDRAGGARKNLRFDGTLDLPKGSYEIVYVTDDSHSNEDWNAAPPHDPFMYGITISAEKDADVASISVSDVKEREDAVIVGLVRVGDDEFLSKGFELKEDTKVRVLMLGEKVNDEEFADCGWIADATTRKQVWRPDDADDEHAGGARKNRMVDDVVTLPKGKYLVSYHTDDSHAYGRWNDDAPFDEEKWGISVIAFDEGFTPASVRLFDEDESDEAVICQIIRAEDGERYRKTFEITRPTLVRIYALGEGEDRRMFDFGWIENARTGKTIWEMTYSMTDHAGGARKNRVVNSTLMLEPGEYELRYETDGSHSYEHWNSDPPRDKSRWGITVFEVPDANKP